MITSQDLIIDQFTPEGDPDKRLTTWYAQGFSDGLGDRLLMFDNTSSPSWEILRFKAALAGDQRFEAALRHRVEELTTFQHAAFPMVRPIRKLGHDDGLAVVSTYVSGASLSDALTKPRTAEFAVRLLRQLVPALAALQQHAPGVAHGALSIDRILLTAEGRLMIREHMVGSALNSLELSPAMLWADFGLLAPVAREQTAILDQRSDVAQLALAALALMAGRRIVPDEYPERVREMLDEIASASFWHRSTLFQALYHWLERALQLGDESFASAKEAHDALGELQDEPQADHFEEKVLVAPKAAPAKDDASPAPMWAAARSLPAAAVEPAPPNPVPAKPAPPAADTGSQTTPFMELWRRVPPVARWTAVALLVLVLGEAAIIGKLLYTGAPGAPPAADLKTDAVRAQATADVQPAVSRPADVAPVPLVAAVVEPKLPDIRPLPPPAAAVQTGGFRITSPIELHVLDGERVVGSSTSGPIMAPAGRREFEFVNSVIGYRVRRAIDVRAGQIVSFTIPIPNGMLNVNATPWAGVWIDGVSYGETPLGNISLVPGEHEIIFRHPQFGERRERTIVRADSETRVSVVLQR
jgi:hypothetical protein